MNVIRNISRRQEWHLVILALLLALVNAAVNFYPQFFTGEFWGIGARSWLWLGVMAAVLHQVYIVVVLRTELETRWLTTNVPRLGYLAYLADYTVLLLLRLGILFIAALANRDMLGVTETNRLVLALALAIPCIWALYQLVKGDGLKCLVGADYFNLGNEQDDPDEASEQYFRSTATTVYALGALGLYIPGVIFDSPAALLLALFNHLYIWVHHFSTELPDRPYLQNPPE